MGMHTAPAMCPCARVVACAWLAVCVSPVVSGLCIGVFACSQGLRSFGLLYYNAATALPLSLLIAYVKGEIDDLMVFPDRLNPVCTVTLDSHFNCSICPLRSYRVGCASLDLVNRSGSSGWHCPLCWAF
jgi:hypothetical protein